MNDDPPMVRERFMAQARLCKSAYARALLDSLSDPEVEVHESIDAAARAVGYDQPKGKYDHITQVAVDSSHAFFHGMHLGYLLGQGDHASPRKAPETGQEPVEEPEVPAQPAPPEERPVAAQGPRSG